MAMRQQGCVVQADETKITVRVMRESACGGNCSMCHGCPSDAILVSCPNDKTHPFSVGETVLLEMSGKSFLSGTLKSYGLLTLTTVLGAGMGYWRFATELASVVGMLVGLLTGTALMCVFAKKEEKFVVKRQNKETEE